MTKLRDKIADIIETHGESILNDEGVDRKVCESIADEIMPSVEEIARHLIGYDDDKTCRCCTKDEWGEDKHDQGCPMRAAYIVLGVLDE